MPKYFDPAPHFTITNWQADEINEATSAAGVTVDGVLLKDGGIVCADAATLEVDTINEATNAAGVTLDGVLLKDNIVTVGTGGTVKTDTVTEKTSAAGVTVDGVKLKDAEVYTDVIKEASSAAGVTADGVLLKDGFVCSPFQVQELTDGGAISIKNGTVFLNKGSAIAATLAAPTDVTDDGKRLLVVSKTAQAHTVTIEGGLNGAGASADVGTFGTAVANRFEVVAHNGKWWAAGGAAVNVTFA